MQMCFYEGKAVYAFEILGENNIIDFDIEKKLGQLLINLY